MALTRQPAASWPLAPTPPQTEAPERDLVFPSNSETQAELLRLREAGALSQVGALEPTAGYAPPARLQPQLGVSPRAGAGFDLACLGSAGERAGFNSGSMLPDLQEPQRPPSHASQRARHQHRIDQRAYESSLPGAREDADVAAILDGMHGLYLPGGPLANPTQVASSSSARTEHDAASKRPRDGIEARESASRDAFELSALREARNRGMPTLAVCGGAWRMLEAFGGQVETIPGGGDHGGHLGKLEERAHGVSLGPGTVLGGTGLTQRRAHQGQRQAQHLGDIDQVNSTHWARARVQGGALAPRPDAPADGPSVRELEISARVPGTAGHQTEVEGFETRHGAPMLGVQWHPEAYQLPGSRAQTGATHQARGQSDNLFKAFGQAMQTYADKQLLLEEIDARVPRQE